MPDSLCGWTEGNVSYSPTDRSNLQLTIRPSDTFGFAGLVVLTVVTTPGLLDAGDRHLLRSVTGSEAVSLDGGSVRVVVVGLNCFRRVPVEDGERGVAEWFAADCSKGD